MTNIFVEKFKKIVTDYFNDVSALREKAKYNSVTFTPTLAQDYNAEVEQEITNKCNHAIAEINTVFNELKAKISIRNFVCGENYNPDTAIFDSKILNQEEFNILLQKYYNDYAFVSARRLVSNYPELAKSTGTIKTASDFVEVYRKFADSAITRIVNSYNKKEEQNAIAEKREPVLLPRFTCHSIRHTFCSQFCEHETNLKVIQEIMGHSDIKTTMNIYSEVSERKKQESFSNFESSIKIMG